MSTTPKVKKTVAATAIAASTLGGIAAGATLLAPGFAGAQDGTDESTETEDTRPEFGTRIAEALQPLVDDGTLDESQVEAVIEALEAARPERGEHGPRRHHGPHGPRGFGGADIAEILGVEPEELREALAGGQTIAEIAEANGVSIESVVEAMVDAAEERVNQALENGRIDQEKADEILAEAEERATDAVNGELEFGRRRGPGRGFGPGGFGPGADEAPEDTDAAA